MPHSLRSKSNPDEQVVNEEYNEEDYDRDSDTSSSCDTPRTRQKDNTPPSIGDYQRPSWNILKVPNAKPTTRRKPRSCELPRTTPRTTPRVLRNEVKAMSGRKFTGTKLVTYGNKIEEKKTGMI